MAAIGIDLGTTYSCVGVINNGEVEIIANENSSRITPSVVAYIDPSGDTPYDILVGESAKKLNWDPEKVVYCSKRLIGRNSDEEEVANYKNKWRAVEVINKDGKPKYEITIQGTKHTFFPEQVSAQILLRMKNMAEEFLHTTVTKAVITVPANFNDNQKSATRGAAAIAGLEVLDLLSEPTAAAVAYGADQQKGKKRHVMAFDFGGGTFDVSIIRINEDGSLAVLVVEGDPQLGGEDIDHSLANYFEQSFHRNKNTTSKLSSNHRAWRRLKDQCEKTKTKLSTRIQENVRIDRIHEGQDLTSSITRGRLEDLASDLFQKTIDVTERAIRKSKLTKEEINDILLVGGSTRIPKIRDLLKNLLPNANMPDTLDPDQCVAVGATILAGVKTEVTLNRKHHLKMWNILPQSLGIGTGRGLMHIFIPRNTCVPISETLLFSTEKDNQTILRFKVYEGENTDTSKNYLLGEFRIAGIPPAPRGVPKIEVTFAVDQDCNLKVTAVDLARGSEKELGIKYDTNRLSPERLEELRQETERHAAHNIEVRKRVTALQNLEDFAQSIRTACLKDTIRNKEPPIIHQMIDEIYKWVDQWHIDQSYPTVQAAQQKKKELENVWNPFIEAFLRPNPKGGAPVLF